MTRPAWGQAACLAAIALTASRASHAQDSAEGKAACVTAAEAGQNQRDDGHYRAARQSFLLCSQPSCPAIITRSCTQWLHDMEGVAPTVVLGARDDRGNDLTDAKVIMDGQPLRISLDGTPMEADAGEHVFRFERDGCAPAEQKILLRAGEKARSVTVLLRSLVPEPPPPAPPPPAAVPEPFMTPRNLTASALVVGALATAGLGAVFLIESNQSRDDAAKLRTGLGPTACAGADTAPCRELSDKVHVQFGDANTATSLFVGAGGVAGAALVTWLLWPRAARHQATGWIAPGHGGAVVGLRGTFE